MHVLKKEKAIRDGSILCDSNSVTFWKRQNRGDSKRISGDQGFGVEVRGGKWPVEHRGLSGSESTLCDPVMADMCHWTSAQTQRMNSIKSEL